MERLPPWIEDQYENLIEAFGRRETEVFSWDEAVEALGIPEGTVGDLLSSLERAGYLAKEVDILDQRMRRYRIVDVTRARQLEERLETWRQVTALEAPPLADAIDRFWDHCRTILSGRVDLTTIPQHPGRLTVQYAMGTGSRTDLRIKNEVKLDHLDSDEQSYTTEILKLFDGSHNAYRSITNVLLEHERICRDLAEGVYHLSVGDYAAVDGVPLQLYRSVTNKSLCPICRRFPQTRTALALITGNPKMDSAFQTYRRSQAKRSSMRVCDYCFTAGWVDLPTAVVNKVGQSVDKGREYLFITTPLPRGDLERLLDFISKRDVESTMAANDAEDVSSQEELIDGVEWNDTEDKISLVAFSQFLKEKYGVEGFDRLAVLGVSGQRLRELQGFVLPSSNTLQRIVAMHVPVQRLVGEDKVSGAVRRELAKATMYDFWQITGGSLHYNRIVPDVSFSVDGQPIEWDEMRHANLAYSIADRYARVGRYRQLDSGLFTLLLSQPRHAVTQILRAKRREQGGQYAPGADKVKEVIEMTEEIAHQDDWRFQLGLRIVELLVTLGLAPRARGFWYRDETTSEFKVYSGVDLVKWIQRIKMMRDADSARAWGTSLINGYRREHDGQGPNTQMVSQILTLVEDIIQTCEAHDYPLRDFARDVANMDYYLLFYYNQRLAAQTQNKEDAE